MAARRNRPNRQVNMRLDEEIILAMEHMLEEDRQFYNRTHLVEQLVAVYYEKWLKGREPAIPNPAYDDEGD